MSVSCLNGLGCERLPSSIAASFHALTWRVMLRLQTTVHSCIGLGGEQPTSQIVMLRPQATVHSCIGLEGEQPTSQIVMFRPQTTVHSCIGLGGERPTSQDIISIG